MRILVFSSLLEKHVSLSFYVFKYCFFFMSVISVTVNKTSESPEIVFRVRYSDILPSQPSCSVCFLLTAVPSWCYRV